MKAQPQTPHLTDTGLSRISYEDFEQENERLSNPTTQGQGQEARAKLESLLAIQERLSKAIGGEVRPLDPLVTLEGTPIIRPHTVNSIQGKYGSHKSRFAELLASLLLSDRQAADTDFLGFERHGDQALTVAYVDTERNLADELPLALQSVIRKAGHQKSPPNFHFTSLKKVARGERLNHLKIFVSHIRQSAKGHIAVFLDVLTDCVTDFNRTDQTNELFDFLGVMCEEQDCSFITVIHENPGGQEGKARGHVGTELMNKVSGAFSIRLDTDQAGRESGLVVIKCLKVRGAKKPPEIHCAYDSVARGLVLVGADRIKDYQPDPLNVNIEALTAVFTDHAGMAVYGLPTKYRERAGIKNQKTAEAHVKQAAERGLIESNGGEGRQRAYKLKKDELPF